MLDSIPIVDPNLIYLILIFGLWAGITAAYTPGTILLETIAFAGFALGIVLLTAVSANWLAVAFLVLGIFGFILLPFIGQRYLRFAEGGLILQGVGGLFMTADPAVSPLLVALIFGISLFYHRYLLIPALKRHWEEPDLLEEQSALIGLIGRATTALDPTGTVYVGGESWTAHSTTPLEAGDEVVVVNQKGLRLFVERVKYKNE